MPVFNPTESPIDTPNVAQNSHLVLGAKRRSTANPATVETDDYPEISAPPAPLQAPETPIAEAETEETLWDGRYSIRNFFGRAIVLALVMSAWIGLATAAWGLGYSSLQFWAYLLGGGVLLYLIAFAIRILRTIRGHHYWLTSKRLFVRTGFLRRRVDQIELVRVKDIYLKQSMPGSWLGIGNVVVVSLEETFPQATLLGIDEPMRIMDLIWRAKRAERDRRTMEISEI
jgi:Bacterial PH domain